MENDERDRRDWPQEDRSFGDREMARSDPDPASPEDQPPSAPGDSREADWAPPADAQPPADEPPVFEDRTVVDERSMVDERSASAEIESWPSEEGGPARVESDERPPSEVEAYPTAGDDASAAEASAHSVPESQSATGESTQCQRCGTENRPGLSFCRNCGQRLVAAGVASTVERLGAPDGTMACPRCGTHNRSGVAFCQNCGANLRGTAPGYVPPSVGGEEETAVAAGRRGAILGPVVLLIGLVGLVTAYLLPFAYGPGSLLDRALGPNGYGVAFWDGYPEVAATLADQAYFGLTGPAPILGLLVLALAIAGFVRAAPGPMQTVGLGIAMLWSVGIIVLFILVEVLGSWDGELVGLLRDLTPAGIIFFLSSLIILIGVLTRFGRS